ncbi:MAG: helix-turn-helix domain-containing protein [Flavobacteriaceae bacterium]|jgi:transcriptional regulator with XRE-family HTH domain|nr:helix-turn-helix domain-containing protein [Flavobacteriaceae bacterium]
MIKEKLIKARKAKQFSQESVASYLKITQGYYAMKESGKAKMYDHEWQRIAELLETPINEIYEEDEMPTQNFANIDASHGYVGNNNVYCNIPDYILQDLHNIISNLQQENKLLKEELKDLKS